MTEQHPITPPRDKIHNWLQLEKIGYNIEQIIALAAQWGADQELEECCMWMRNQHLVTFNDRIPSLRAARRPKPPSLKEQALEQLDGIAAVFRMSHGGDLVCDTIRRALEQLDD